MSIITLSSWADAKAALRNRDLRQGLYDEGVALMHGVIVNLHGAEHNARRRLENRLFRRDTFAFLGERPNPPQHLRKHPATHCWRPSRSFATRSLDDDAYLSRDRWH